MKKDAEQEIAHMQYRLALDFEKGNGVTKDLKKASFWLEKAADQGHAQAQRKSPTRRRASREATPTRRTCGSFQSVTGQHNRHTL